MENLQAALGKLQHCSTAGKSARRVQSGTIPLPDVVKINNSFDLSEANRRKLSEILKEFDNFPIGETNETYKGYVFNSHDQKEDESVDAYVGELRTLAQLCNFCMCLHDTLICNLVVLGICDEGSCKRLFRQGKLTLQKIYRNH